MNLSKLLDIQVSDKFKTGVGYDSQVFDSQVFDSQMNDKSNEGYHVVPPPYTGNFMPLKHDFVPTDKDEYVFSESKPKSHVKSPRESVKKVENSKQANYPKKNSQSPRGNKRNWNNLMTQKLGSNFEFQNKAFYVCGSFNHLIKDCDYYEKKMVEKPMWNNARRGNPQLELQEKGVIDSGCSRHMTGNKSYLSDYEEIDGRFVAFGGNSKGGKITGKGKIRTGTLDFEDVYFVKELKFNLFSVSQMCDKKNDVLFTDTECVVLSPDFKLTDESHVLLKVPRKDNMYSVDLKNVVPQGGLTCLFAKATLDESNLWHRRLGHINFKTMNKLVRGNLIRGIENQINHRVKIIRCDKGTKFKNKEMNQFCEMKGIKREFSVARTPQQNGVAERKNRTLIEAARTMLADSKLPTTFWAEAVNTACYVQNRVLVIKPHNKTPYELFHGRTPSLSFMRPFGCLVTILNTLDHLGKFDGKADEGFFVGYSVNSKAFRVFNSRTRIVEETLHITFLKNKPNVARSGPEWLFDIDTLIKSMNYKPVVAGNQSNGNAGEEEKKDAENSENKNSEVPSTKEPRVNQEKDANINSTNNINIVSPTVNVASIKDSVVDENRCERGSRTAKNRPGTERTENRKFNYIGTENWTERHLSVPVRFSVPVRVSRFLPIRTDLCFMSCTHINKVSSLCFISLPLHGCGTRN
ncbi:ribonuclease H-like domain-containing protein [Tanacetum coccineum]